MANPERGIPVENRVLTWLRSHRRPSVHQCADDLGIGTTSVIVAAMMLEKKGLIASEVVDELREGVEP